MELVWKTNPRGQLERKLNLAEREALLHVFSNGRKPAQADLRIAYKILEEMDRSKLWSKICPVYVVFFVRITLQGYGTLRLQDRMMNNALCSG